jgi:hypothetical protein
MEAGQIPAQVGHHVDKRLPIEPGRVVFGTHIILASEVSRLWRVIARHGEAGATDGQPCPFQPDNIK